jgi:hypothetical protein
MDITQLRNEMMNKSSRIPNFIETTSVLDHAIWNNMRYISDILLQLVIDKIIKDRAIEVIIQQVDLELEMIGDVSDKVFTIQIYFEMFLDYMLERSIQEERYEAATNIRNFITIYKNNYQI